jgi:hypothetical protein
MFDRRNSPQNLPRMKTRAYAYLSAALACGWLTFTLTAAAQGNGSETFNASFALTATPNAPSGAKGRAVLKSNTHDGTQTMKMLLSTHGLDPGDYILTAVRTSNGEEVILGQITVPEPGQGHHKTDTKDKMTIVADVPAADIGELILSDTNGVAMLQGDLGSPGSSANLTATVPVTGGELAPLATGSAKLKVTVRNGHRKDSFVMKVSEVPPVTVLTINVDGIETGTVKSTRDGRVVVKKIPEGMGNIDLVVLTAGGDVALADF